MCSVSKYTKGPYSTDKLFYFHKETINIKCDEGFQPFYQYYDEYSRLKYGYIKDQQINVTCNHGNIHLNDSIELTKIDCEQSNYFCSYV